MSKIRINIVNGMPVEKPLINYFKTNTGDYIILDNEMNGSMGYPIILVSKVVDNKLIKIVDLNEWNQVKDYLKQIISGTKFEWLEAPKSFNADDLFYTQLTLPVVSFDSLKNSYVVEVKIEQENLEVDNVQNAEVQTMDESVNLESVVPNDDMFKNDSGEEVNTFETFTPEANVNDVINQTVNVEETVLNNLETEVSSEFNNVVNDNSAEQSVVDLQSEPVINFDFNAAPVINTEENVTPLVQPEPQVQSEPANVPSNDFNTVSPIIDDTSIMNNSVITDNVENINNEMPVVDMPVFNGFETPQTTLNNVEPEQTQETLVNTEEIDFSTQKEAFLEACSNMFDALVEQIQNRK